MVREVPLSARKPTNGIKWILKKKKSTQSGIDRLTGMQCTNNCPFQEMEL